MMFFKSKPRAEKLDKTLTTKLDKIFQYFKAKEEPFECGCLPEITRLRQWQSQPIGIMVKPI